MDMLTIEGGVPLNGTVNVSGAKNAALPIMAATLLAKGLFTLTNIPNLRDVKTLAHLLRIIGARVNFEKDTMSIETSHLNFFEAPYELVKTMRASIYVLGPLVARYGRAKVSLPGGCAWGPRPVNFHLEGLKKMGAQIELEKGYIIAKAERLKGTQLTFDVPSVGATGNLLMAAVLAEGTTVIENAAKEPEIEALARFLVKMGAKISGIGTVRLEIEGVDELYPINYVNIPDRIEALTYLIAGLATNGQIELKNCAAENINDVLAKLEMAGAIIEKENRTVRLKSSGSIRPVDVETAVYPGFPTDGQAQWTALMSVANGASMVTDNIYNDRFAHVPELNRLGAQIQVRNNAAFIRGVKQLTGAQVMSTDLRASASLVIAGLVAKGKTDIHRVYHLDRGYEAIEKKLEPLGARIIRSDDGKFY